MSAPNGIDLIAKLYAARDLLKKELGPTEYEAKTRPIRVELRRLMFLMSCNEMVAAAKLLEHCPKEQQTVLGGFIYSAAIDIDTENAKANLHAKPQRQFPKPRFRRGRGRRG